MPPSLEAWSPNHWTTREFPQYIHLSVPVLLPFFSSFFVLFFVFFRVSWFSCSQAALKIKHKHLQGLKHVDPGYTHSGLKAVEAAPSSCLLLGESVRGKMLPNLARHINRFQMIFSD